MKTYNKFELSVLNDTDAWAVKAYKDCDCGTCKGLMATARPACPNCRHTLNKAVETLQAFRNGEYVWVYQTICSYCKANITLLDGMTGIV